MKEGGGGWDALLHVYMGAHIVSLYYGTTWWMFMKLGRDELSSHCLHMCLGFLSDPPLGGSKAGQEGVKESFQDKILYLEYCHSGTGFGQIFQGVDPGREKKVEEELLLWRNPLSDEIFTATYWCIADDTVDTCIYLNPVILVVFFSDWTVCCWLSGEW